jgi:hypothetical protein
MQTAGSLVSDYSAVKKPNDSIQFLVTKKESYSLLIYVAEWDVWFRN